MVYLLLSYLKDTQENGQQFHEVRNSIAQIFLQLGPNPETEWCKET